MSEEKHQGMIGWLAQGMPGRVQGMDIMFNALYEEGGCTIGEILECHIQEICF